MTAPTRPYDRVLRPITLDDALATPAADALFVEPLPGGHPRMVISTTIEAEGHKLSLTFYDTPVDQVLAILRRQVVRLGDPNEYSRHDVIAGISGNKRRRRARPQPPQYATIWSDFDFDDAPEPDAHGAAVVETARLLLEQGQAAGWSNALEAARRSLTTQEILQ